MMMIKVTYVQPIEQNCIHYANKVTANLKLDFRAVYQILRQELKGYKNVSALPRLHVKNYRGIVKVVKK